MVALKTRVKPSEADTRPLRIAVPKKGRLCAAFSAAMDAGGLRIEKDNERLDFGALRDAEDTFRNVEALQMRGYDALRTLAAGAADMAVVGFDMLREFNANNPALADAAVTGLGLTPCALYIAAAMDADITEPRDLRGLRVATSFPGLLRAWLAENDVAGVDIIECEGGVEDMIRLGLADAVCDLVETGGTLAANGLDRKIKVLDSEAVLVVRAGLPETAFAVARRVERGVSRAVPA